MYVLRLREILAERNIIQSDLARMVGCDKNTISHWCSRKKPNINIDLLWRICHVLEITPNDIFEEVPSVYMVPGVGDPEPVRKKDNRMGTSQDIRPIRKRRDEVQPPRKVPIPMRRGKKKNEG